MQWIRARLAEDSTRSGLGQLGLLLALLGPAIGLDVPGLLAAADAWVAKGVAAAGLAVAAVAPVLRVVTPDKPSVTELAAGKALEMLREGGRR